MNQKKKEKEVMEEEKIKDKRNEMEEGKREERELTNHMVGKDSK